MEYLELKNTENERVLICQHEYSNIRLDTTESESI